MSSPVSSLSTVLILASGYFAFVKTFESFLIISLLVDWELLHWLTLWCLEDGYSSRTHNGLGRLAQDRGKGDGHCYGAHASQRVHFWEFMILQDFILSCFQLCELLADQRPSVYIASCSFEW